MKKRRGHYCKVCGQYKANEKFSGRGHAAHICKACARLSPQDKAENITLNRLDNLPWQLSKEQRNWLKARTHDKNPEIRAAAQEHYDMRFKRYDTASFFDEDFEDDELEDFEEIGEDGELPSFDSIEELDDFELPF